MAPTAVGEQREPTLDVAYMNLLRGPMCDSVGFLARKTQSREFSDFDPENLMEQLIKHSKLNHRTPEEFHHDIFSLISIQCFKDKINKENLLALKSRYNIKDNCTSPNCVTLTRLRIMFPHFCFVDSCGLPKFDFSSTSGILKLIQQPEFAGLIPVINNSNLIIRPNIQSNLIFIHLYGLSHSQPLMSHAELFEQFMWRHKKSLLSNGRRAWFLANLGVITGDALSSKMQVIREETRLWHDSTAFRTFGTTFSLELYERKSKTYIVSSSFSFD